MLRHLQYLFLLSNLLLFISCKKDKLKSPESSFLVANTVSLNTNFFTQGTNSQKITDIWYYVNGQFKGVFPVGNVMPIVASGSAEITLFAGVKNNGISATRIPYPFYNSITLNQECEPGKTYTIAPVFQYNSGTFFYYHEEFESTGCYFTSAGDSDFVWTSDPLKTFGGTGKSIFMSMSDSKPTARMLQSTAYFLPSGGATVYLELNYKCNQPFTVGVIGGGSDERTALTVNTSNEWNKIYIQLTSVISTQPTYPDYKVFIHADKQVASPEIYIDNVKLIYQ